MLCGLSYKVHSRVDRAPHGSQPMRILCLLLIVACCVCTQGSKQSPRGWQVRVAQKHLSWSKAKALATTLQRQVQGHAGAALQKLPHFPKHTPEAVQPPPAPRVEVLNVWPLLTAAVIAAFALGWTCGRWSHRPIAGEACSHQPGLYPYRIAGCSPPQLGANHAGRGTQAQATQTDEQPAVQAGVPHSRAVDLSSSGPPGQLQLLDEQAGAGTQSEAAETHAAEGDAASGTGSAQVPCQLEEFCSAPEQQQAEHSSDAASASVSETAAADARTGQVPACGLPGQATSPPDNRPLAPAALPDSDSAGEHTPGLRQGAADPPDCQLWNGGSSPLARHASPALAHRRVLGSASAAAPSPSVALRAAQQELPPDVGNLPHWDEVGTSHSSSYRGC